MAHTGIYATSAECIFKMGNGYSTSGVDEDRINELCLQVESFINDLCRQVFAADAAAFAALTSGKKYLLTLAASSFVGFFGTQYDASGYGSQREGENIININWEIYLQCLGLLKNQEAVTFIK